MRTWTLVIAAAAFFALSASADERATVTGKVADAAGKPVEHATVTIILPLFSGRLATSRAATTFAPVEIPTRSPSSLASRLAIANESSLVT